MSVSTSEAVCPICREHVVLEPQFRNGADRIRKCRACSAAFVHPRPNGPELLSQYSPHYFRAKYESLRESGYLSMDAWREKTDLCFARVSKLRGGKPGLMMDFGCGKGWLLEAARDRGWQVQGLELCPEVAKEVMERVGTHIYTGSIFDVALPSETFDLVTMFDVIEHLEQPLEALLICHRILKPGGVLVISTPNLSGIGCRLLGARAFGMWPDEHIVYFGPAAMNRALRLARFANVEISSRAVYPENVAAILSRLQERNNKQAEITNEVRDETRSIKELFRNNVVLRGLRTTLNRFFAAVPIGDELLAFAVKQ
jgi:2-polyprenyl-3-methyl-5-hydroxy-6-metoxy-1,4-benzoquinol methylase